MFYKVDLSIIVLDYECDAQSIAYNIPRRWQYLRAKFFENRFTLLDCYTKNLANKLTLSVLNCSFTQDFHQMNVRLMNALSN